MGESIVIAGLLNNEDLEFVESKVFRGGHLWVVKKKRREFEICPRCAGKTNTRAGACESKVRARGVSGKPLWLLIKKHRYRCRPCKKVFVEPVQGIWPRRRTTNGFRRSVWDACGDFKSLSLVCQRMKVSSGFVFQVFYEQAAIKLRERRQMPWPSVLGIDEHFFRREKRVSKFVTLFTDLSRRTLFEVCEGKSKDELIEQIAHIPGRDKVRIVCIDLCSPYRALVHKLFPNAKIVADKFHVLRLMNPHIIKARKDIHGHRKDLALRRLLLTNWIKLDYDKKFELRRYLDQYPELKLLYQAKERLHSLYRTRGHKNAQKAIHRFIQWLGQQTLSPLGTLKNTLQKWKNEILQYFDFKMTNAFTEVTNRAGKLIQARACGFKKFQNYRLALLSDCLF